MVNAVTYKADNVRAISHEKHVYIRANAYAQVDKRNKRRQNEYTVLAMRAECNVKKAEAAGGLTPPQEYREE